MTRVYNAMTMFGHFDFDWWHSYDYFQPLLYLIFVKSSELKLQKTTDLLLFGNPKSAAVYLTNSYNLKVIFYQPSHTFCGAFGPLKLVFTP